VSRNALQSATTTIGVAAAAAPRIGQVLTATGGSAATWQTPAVASTGNILQTGTPLDTHVGYFTADKNLSGDAGFTWITASSRLNIIGASPITRQQDNDNVGASLVAAKIEVYDSKALVAQVGVISTHAGELS